LLEAAENLRQYMEIAIETVTAEEQRGEGPLRANHEVMDCDLTFRPLSPVSERRPFSNRRSPSVAETPADHPPRCFAQLRTFPSGR
jgi:hypothetical protein